jgi:Surfeit locus protein 6
MKSVKDVRDENDRKRKRQEEEGPDPEGIEVEKPREGLKGDKKTKKQKKDGKAESGESKKDEAGPTEAAKEPATPESIAAVKAQKVKEKKERKAQRAKEQEDKLKAKQVRKLANKTEKTESAADVPLPMSDVVEDGSGDLQPMQLDGLDNDAVNRSTASPSPNRDSQLDTAEISGASSTSSIVPPTDSAIPEKENEHTEKPIIAKVDPEELKARLTARIEALRKARKADGPEGRPARNRQELMEARRKKEEQRKAHKKELRAKAKEEERLKEKTGETEDKVVAKGGVKQKSLPEDSENNFSFGRVSFGDGLQTDASLSNIIDLSGKKKGAKDPLGALRAAEKKQQRLENMDDEKRGDIEEKELWLNAKKRAQGEKVRDEVGLLKKTLKRSEKAKGKSEKEWKEREAGVKKGQHMKQQKRESNLKKRKDESKKGKKMAKSAGKPSGGVKKKSRPGFEGSFAGKAKPGKH